MPSTEQLLINETNHRCANDLQMVIALLNLQHRRSNSVETKAILADLMERVSVVAHARSYLQHHPSLTLEAALSGVVSALKTYANPFGIEVSSSLARCDFLSENKVMILSLVANELATNAIKHAFKEEKTGTITISVADHSESELLLVVDDDGLPFPEVEARRADGLGLGLVAMLLYSIGAKISFPSSGEKRFEIVVSKG
jgi:two-component sensor histidine kinase